MTIAEREAIQKKSNSDDVNDYALQMMIEKSLDKDGNRLFQDGTCQQPQLTRAISEHIREYITSVLLRHIRTYVRLII